MDHGWRAHVDYMAEKAREKEQAPTQQSYLSIRPYPPQDKGKQSKAQVMLLMLPETAEARHG